jgi:hypothetical protein
MNPAAEGGGESTTPSRAMAVVEGGTRKQQEYGHQQQEEEELEEELDNTILQVTLHPSSFVRIHKMSFPELCKSFRFLFSFLGQVGFWTFILFFVILFLSVPAQLRSVLERYKCCFLLLLQPLVLPSLRGNSSKPYVLGL